MNNKLKEKLDSWDLRSVFLTALFLVIGVFLFFYFTDIRDRFRTTDKRKFKGNTIGEIISVKKVERISQSRWSGTNVYVDNYQVTYRYSVAGQEYESIDIIPFTMTNQKLLTGILKRGVKDTCYVKFDIEEPEKSVLIENVTSD